MKAFLWNILHLLIWQHKFEIEKRLSKSQVFNRVENFVRENNKDYHGYFYRMSSRFIVNKDYLSTHGRNSFAPVADGKVLEDKGWTTVSIVLRPTRFAQIMIIPIFWMACSTLILAPFAFLLQYVVFLSPALRMKKMLETSLL